MNKNMELLAPAGTYDAFIAAVENGADAVYLGGKLFNARANATNFDIEQLKEMVDYAHLRGVKIHLTMNILLDDTELKEALDFAYSIYEIGVDAVIIQDLGLAKILHAYLPELPLHASTQISAHNIEGVKELTKIGFSRVVLARELSIPEIRVICENTNTEIEIFAHGALCVSYSGQCLMSSMIGNRSGNRGKCAQPCRLPYKLIKNKTPIASGYLLSPKDLCTVEILKEIPNITCLKVEGRMKSPEYVATVVRTYRKYIDGTIKASKENKAETKNTMALKGSSIQAEDKQDLIQIFNRGGFTTGYLKQKMGKDMMCYEKSKNWGTYIGKVTNYDGKRYITLDDTSKVQIGDGIEVWNHTNDSPSTIVSEKIKNKIGRIHGNIKVGDKVYKTYDKALMQKAKESYSRGFVKHSPVCMFVKIQENEPIEIQIEEYTYLSTIVPQKAQKQPLTKERLQKQFSKTGNTPFVVQKLTIQLGQDLFLPVSTINELRRMAFEGYEKFFLSHSHRSIVHQKLQMPKEALPSSNLQGSDELRAKKDFSIANKKVSVFFHTLREEYLHLRNVDTYYFTFRDALTKMELIKQFPGEKYIVFPTITKGNYSQLIAKNIETMALNVNGFVLSHIAQLQYVQHLKAITKIANYTIHTFNSFTLELLKECGFQKVILSPELTKEQINALSNFKDVEKEVIAYGNLCVMTSEYCPVGSLAGGFSKDKKCSKPCQSKEPYYLRDRMQKDFRVLPDAIDCQCEIYNTNILSIETANVNSDSIRLDVLDESSQEMQKVIDTHRLGKKLSRELYTNGHFNRPV